MWFAWFRLTFESETVALFSCPPKRHHAKHNTCRHYVVCRCCGNGLDPFTCDAASSCNRGIASFPRSSLTPMARVFLGVGMSAQIYTCTKSALAAPTKCLHLAFSMRMRVNLFYSFEWEKNTKGLDNLSAPPWRH